MAHLKRTEFGKVDLDYVLGVGGFDLERLFLDLLFLVGFFFSCCLQTKLFLRLWLIECIFNSSYVLLKDGVFSCLAS